MQQASFLQRGFLRSERRLTDTKGPDLELDILPPKSLVVGKSADGAKHANAKHMSRGSASGFR